MTDRNKATALISGAAVLVLLVLSSNVFLDDYLAGLGERAGGGCTTRTPSGRRGSICTKACTGKRRSE